MKTFALLIAFAGLSGLISAQTDPVSAAFEKYANREGITTVQVSGDMLNMMARASEKMHDTLFQSSLSDMRVLVEENDCDGERMMNPYEEVYLKLDKKAYKEMITVKEENEQVVILMKENDGKISEMLVLVSGKDENVILQIKGNMLMSEMMQMAGNFNMKGFDHLHHYKK